MGGGHGEEAALECSLSGGGKTVRYRTSEYPEKVMINHLFRDTALAKFKADHPSVSRNLQQQVMTFKGPFPSVAAVREGPEMDTAAPCQCLGAGRPPTQQEQRVGVAAIQEYLQQRGGSVAGWVPDDLQSSKMWVHTYADIRSGEVVTSQAYPFLRSRQSHHIVVRYITDRVGEPQPYVGTVRYFVRLHKPAQLQPLAAVGMRRSGVASTADADQLGSTGALTSARAQHYEAEQAAGVGARNEQPAAHLPLQAQRTMQGLAGGILGGGLFGPLVQQRRQICSQQLCLLVGRHPRQLQHPRCHWLGCSQVLGLQLVP
ncbi:hypothetical protein N2152v2_001494 [Parachlorella kessleri]